MIRIIPATPEHIAMICADVRACDVAEVEASSGNSVASALQQGLEAGDAFAAFWNDEPLCLFGVVGCDEAPWVGAPWAIGTNAITKHKRAFMRESLKQMRKAAMCYSVLVNYVDDRNDVAKQWLTWLGFRLHDPEPYGVQQMPFRMFVFERD